MSSSESPRILLWKYFLTWPFAAQQTVRGSAASRRDKQLNVSDNSFSQKTGNNKNAFVKPRDGRGRNADPRRTLNREEAQEYVLKHGYR